MFSGIGLAILLVSLALGVWAHADTRIAEHLRAGGALREGEGAPVAPLIWEGGNGRFGAEHDGDKVFKFLPGYEPFVAPVGILQPGDRVAVLVSPGGDEALLISEALLRLS
jgi:hypothetical protein